MAHDGKNNQDLKRPIPAAVMRQVRERCGFGCVICGSMFYQYDHIGVEFKDAEVHDPEKIVLLCGGCHDKKTRKFLSTETIERYAKSPRAKQSSFSWGELDVGIDFPEVVMGTVTAKRTASLINIYGEDVFSILPPEKEGLPFRVNAIIYNKSGQQVAKIINNEFQALTGNWDVEVVGGRVSIRSALGVFDLVVRVEPPSRLVIERLDMFYKGVSVTCLEGGNTTFELEGSKINAFRCEVSDFDIAVQFDGRGIGLGCNNIATT